MDNVKEVVKKRETTLREEERKKIFMYRKKWTAFFSDRPYRPIRALRYSVQVRK